MCRVNNAHALGHIVDIIEADEEISAECLFDTIRELLPAGEFPLLNHPLEKRRALIEGCFRRLKPYAPFIQFSYGFYKPVPPPPGVAATLAAFVWLNVPPTHVWVYRQKTENGKQGSERRKSF